MRNVFMAGTTEWYESGSDNTRWVRCWSFWPTFTLDCGWIIFWPYWRFEREWGFGFFDKSRYVAPIDPDEDDDHG